MNFFENIAKQKIVWRPFMNMVYTELQNVSVRNGQCWPWNPYFLQSYLLLHFYKFGNMEYCDKVGIISPISPDPKPLSFFT